MPPPPPTKEKKAPTAEDAAAVVVGDNCDDELPVVGPPSCSRLPAEFWLEDDDDADCTSSTTDNAPSRKLFIVAQPSAFTSI